MPLELVVKRRAETRRRHLAAGKIAGDLMQSEQLEMVDQECAGEHDHPAKERQPSHRRGHLRIVDLPDLSRYRTPLPKQQHKREAREQHEGTAFDRFRHELRPPLLELLARHHTVLNGEDGHQEKVDDERLGHRHDRSAVDGLWHHEARDEADGIEAGDEKWDVGCESVQKGDETAHGTSYVLADRLDLSHGLLRSVAITRDRDLDPQNAESATPRLCPALDLSLRLS